MTEPADTDKRSTRRQRVLKGAKALFADKSVVDCAVRDLSDTGAKIVCDAAYKMPDSFELLLPAESKVRPVKVVWRKDNQIGVTFTGEARAAPARKF